jgi:hypothetical protein
MAFTNQTTTSLADLISKLNTFLSTNGWTTHHVPASGEFAARKTATGVDVALATQWDTTSPSTLGIYQWQGAAYNSGSSPWAQNNDSGNGAASTSNATLGTSRSVGLGNTPIQFWCFEEDYYFHVVVETSAGTFQHFGAGNLDKFNDFTGGDYVYGQRQHTTFASRPAVTVNTSCLLDGLVAGTNLELYAATVHLTGMLNQPSGGLYGVVMGAQGAANLGNDRQTVAKGRVHLPGGFRGGFGVLNWGIFPGDIAAGLLPGYPVVIMHKDVLGGSATNDFEGPLGRMKDVRGMSIENYAGGDELTIGGDTWIIFPSYKKWVSGGVSGTTGYQGIIYKKITP